MIDTGATMNKPSVEVEIMGQKFVLSGDTDETYLRSVARYVDDRAREVLENNPPFAKASVAILTALNIADEYHRLKEKYETLSRRLEHLSHRVSVTLTEEG
jgi:cell division protein ZapA